MGSYKYRLLKRIKDRTDISMKDLELVYKEYFGTVQKVFNEGTHPGIVITGLLSMQFSAPALKRKAKTLTEVIVAENFLALKKRFKCDTLEEGRELLSSLIAIYKMKEAFDIQNIQAKKRKNNGWLV